MPKYTIVPRGGGKQRVVEADSYTESGSFIEFEVEKGGGSKDKVLRLRQDEVESVIELPE